MGMRTGVKEATFACYWRRHGKWFPSTKGMKRRVAVWRYWALRETSGILFLLGTKFLLPALVSGWLAMDEMLFSASVAARRRKSRPFARAGGEEGEVGFVFEVVGCLAPKGF